MTAADYARHWDKTRRDTMLMVWSLALLFLIQVLVTISGMPSPRWASNLGLLALIAQPYLMLRLVAYLRPVPRRLMQAALIGLLIFWVVLIVWTPTPRFVALIEIAYFVLIDGYAMVALIRGAVKTSGVARYRLRFAAAGSGLLALVLLIIAAAAFIPALTGLLTVLALVALIGSGIAYSVGFAPPRWLRRSWQFAEINRYLSDISSKPTDERLDIAESLSELCLAANQAVGGMAGGIVQRDEEDRRWVLRSHVNMPAEIAIDDDGVIARAWREGVSRFVHISAALTARNRQLMQSVGADSMLVVPIVTRERTWGLLLVFQKYGSLFSEDDLNLVTLIANQSAISLENSLLLERIRQYSAGLEDKVEERTKALRESEGRYQHMLDNMLEGCQILSRNWDYLYINDAAATYGRAKKDELLGHNLLEKYPGIENTPMFAAMKACMDERNTQVQEFEFFYGDGDKAWFEFSIQPVPEGIFILSLDITERKRIQEALQSQNEELERRVVERTQQLEFTNKELEAFSYSVSHDLRSPLRAIDGFSQALAEDYADKLDDAGQNYLTRIRNGSQRMGQLIDDLLDLSRLSRSEMRHERVDLSTMAQRLVGELREQYPERNVEIKVEDGMVVTGDSRLLRVALANLLNNAWKYTGKQAKPCVEFGSTVHEGRRAYYVRDNGAGFNMTYADKLFGVFQRLHNMNEFPGNGIGLATVQRILHRHGGTVWAEGAIDKGATFYFSLNEPAAEVNAA